MHTDCTTFQGCKDTTACVQKSLWNRVCFKEEARLSTTRRMRWYFWPLEYMWELSLHHIQGFCLILCFSHDQQLRMTDENTKRSTLLCRFKVVQEYTGALRTVWSRYVSHCYPPRKTSPTKLCDEFWRICFKSPRKRALIRYDTRGYYFSVDYSTRLEDMIRSHIGQSIVDWITFTAGCHVFKWTTYVSLWSCMSNFEIRYENLSHCIVGKVWPIIQRKESNVQIPILLSIVFQKADDISHMESTFS